MNGRRFASSKKILWMTAAITVLLSTVLLCVGICHIRSADELDRRQEEALAELAAKKGSYDPQSIVLTNTSRTRAQKLADITGGTLRITENGKFATVTLPEGKTVYDFFSTEEAREWIPELSADYQVAAADVDELVKEPSMPNYTVTDPSYDRQVYLGYLNIGETWNTTHGGGVTVAVIDTGIDTDHPEFEGKISEYSYNATDDKIVKDYDLSVIEDEQGHGTAVAGVIAAAMNDGNGTVGIAPEVTLIVIKAECDADGNYLRGSDLVFGLYYAIERGADVVNMSFGGPENIYAEAAQLAVDSDVICVASAGNDGTAMLTYPAADENVIGVGALASDSWELASYSNYGENSDIVAPGTVYTSALGGGYKTADGTSFASPAAAAAIALYLSQNQYTEFTDMTEVLYASSVDLGDLGEDSYYGYGALDINALVIEEKGIITFEMLTDEVDNIERVYVKGHTLQNIPLDLERNYSVFDGWFYGYDCAEGDELDLYTTVFSSDITLYASWVNEDDGVPYTCVILDDGTVEIRSYTGKRRYITIPDKIEGRVVSSIGEGAFANQTRLREITLPTGLQVIRDSAFEGCSSLTNVIIPDGVTSIGRYAYADCVRMRSISFGKGSKLNSIGEFAFAGTGLMRFEAPKNLLTVDGSAFYGATSLTYIDVASGNGQYASLDGVLVNSVKDTVIAYPAGRGGEYTLPESIGKIGDYAFAFASLSSVDFANVTSVGSFAFASSRLKAVSIPDSVTSVGVGAFEGCVYNKSVTVGAGVVNLPARLFEYNTALTSIKLDENTLTIGASAFNMCISLKSLDLSANTSLVMIDSDAFSCCFALESVKLSDSGALTTIGNGTFGNCYALENINLPSTLNLIGSKAFANTVALSSVTLPDGLVSIGEMAFISGGLSGTLKVPASVESLGAGAFADCDALTYIDIADGNTYYTDIDGVVYSIDQKNILAYPSGNARTEYTVLDGVTAAQSYAFYGSDVLTSIYLPESLTEIKEYGISNVTSLAAIAIPDNVTLIGRYAFSECYNMASVSFGEGSKLPRIGFASFANTGITSIRIPANVSTVAQYAFAGSTKLQTVTFAQGSKLDIIPAYMFVGSEQITSIVFEEGSALESISAHGFEGMSSLTELDFTNTRLTNVGNFAFRFCSSLANITLPEGVTYLGRYAFYQCGALADVTLPESLDYIGRYAFLGAENANVYFASELLPANLQENWDYGIKGYYTGVQSVAQNELWQYAELTGGGYAILDYFGSATSLDLNSVDLDADGANDAVVNIGGYAFADADFAEITLPDGLTAIQRYAFVRTDALADVNIPSSVEFIGQYAFYGSGIEAVTFESGAAVKNIEQYAFSRCAKLSSVTLPDSLTALGTGAFAESGLTSVSFGTGLTEIPNNAFYKTKLSYVTIPSGLEKLGYYAFAGIDTLESVAFTGTTELMVMGNAFSDGNIKSVTIPANVVYLGEFAFSGNDSLTSYTVAEGNKYYCSADGILYNKAKTKLIAYPAGLTGSFEVPEFVETIGFGAFQNSKLTELIFADGINLLTLGNRAFYGSAIEQITIPASVVSIDYYAFATCEALETVIFESGTALRGIYEGAFLNCTSLTNIEIPDAIVEISDFAFYGCRNLTEIPISSESALRGVYDYSFAYTGLSGELSIPETLIDIGPYAFAGLKVTSVYIPNTERYDLIIGIGAFEDCNELVEITLPFVGASYNDFDITWLGYIFGAGAYEANATYIPESLKTVTLLDGVTTLGTGAFYGVTTLETLNIPDSVENIYEYSFYECTVKYELTNTVEFWDAYGYKATELTQGHIGKGISGHLEILEGVTSISNHTFYDCSNLTSVTIPDGVTSIDVWAFAYCDFVTIDIPNTVTSIGEGAFAYCYALRDITIPNGVTSVEKRLFIGCNSLSSVTLPDTITGIGDTAFLECYNLMSITIPENVDSIGEMAFQSCTNLYEVINKSSLDLTLGSDEHGYVACYALSLTDADGNVTYRDGVDGFTYIDTADGWRFMCENDAYTLITYIGDSDTATIPRDINGRAYEIKLSSTPEHIIIPYGIESIGDEAFRECRNLENITISDSVTSIGNYAFFDCSSLTSIDIPDSVTSVGYGAFFWCTNLESAILSNSLTELSTNLFQCCYNLTEIVIPNGVTNIGEQAFSQCYNLASVTLPDSLERISYYAFYGCSSLNSIIIPKSVAYIDTIAFKESGLEEIVITSQNNNYVAENGVVYNKDKTQIVFVSDSVTSIVVPSTVIDFSFSGAENLETVEFEEGSQLSSIPQQAFLGCSSLTSVTIPEGVTYIGTAAFQYCSSLTSITIPEGVTVIGGAFLGCSSLTSVELPESLTYIDGGAFELCESLESITIPESVTYIGDMAFYGCSSLTSINIPNSISYIGYGTFWGCISIESIELPEKLTNIGAMAFDSCSGLTSIKIPENVTNIGENAFASCSGLTSVEIPNGVTTIGNGTFAYCSNLTSISIPNSVTSIGRQAFSCSGLMSIVVPESVTSISEDAFLSCVHLYEVTNNSALEFTIGGYDNGFISHWAKKLTDKDGNVTYADGCEDYAIIDTADGWRFMLANGMYTLLGYYGDSDTATLPLNINGNSYAISVKIAPKHLIIPDGITDIENFSFAYSKNLVSVTVPNSVTGIGQSAFEGCTNLTSINIPDSVTSIGYNAFTYCTKLESINIPDSVTYVGTSAFYDTAYYNNPDNWVNGMLMCDGWLLELDETVEYIDEYCKVAEGVSSYTLKMLVTDGNAYLYNRFPNLETLCLTELPEYDIYYSVFSGSLPITLKNIVIDGGANALPGDSVFAYITGVEIWVSATKADCGWDENFPGWSNGNTVHYADEWIEVTFIDGEGKIVSNEYLTVHEIIKRPYVDLMYTDGVEYYIFVGWDIDGDGTADALPATSAVDVRAVAIYKKCEHSYTSVVTDPTCTEQGYTTHTCDECGDSYIDTYVDATGHTEVIDPAKDATCTETGLTEGKHCSVCDEVLVEQEEIPALGHDYASVITDPTCTEQGYTTHTCDECGDSYIDTYVDATGHDYERTTRGEKYVYTCTVCGHSYEEDIEYTSGELNGDGTITSDDAVYLLFHVMFPQQYPLDQSCDFNSDGNLNSNDAVYLLFHVMFPQQYPLPEPSVNAAALPARKKEDEPTADAYNVI